MRYLIVFLLIAFSLVAAIPSIATPWTPYYFTNDSQGHCYDYRINIDDRIRYCDKALTSRMLTYPQGLATVEEMGALYTDKYDYKNAIVMFTAGLHVAKHDDIARFYLDRGDTYLYFGELDLAKADFLAAFQKQGDPGGLAGLAAIEARLGLFDKAVADYKRAEQLQPSNPYFVSALAATYAQMGNYDASMKEIQSLISVYYYTFAYNNRCWFRAVANRDLAAGLADCNHALDQIPSVPEYLDSRGFIYFRLGQWKKSIADYNAVLAINPYNAGAIYMRGIAEIRDGQSTEGHADIVRASVIFPDIGANFASYGVTP